MNRLELLVEELKAQIKAAPVLADVGDLNVHIERSSHPNFGDLTTNIALQVSKLMRVDPMELAEKITEYLNEQALAAIAKVEVLKPGFINFYFSDEFLSANVAEVLQSGDDFGRGEWQKGQRIVIEHTSPNPNKAMHLGHLRNNLVGMSLANVLRFSGATVTTDAIYNDRGIAIAKLMYGFLACMKKDESLPTEVAAWLNDKNAWFIPEEKGVGPDIFVAQCYVAGEKLFKASPEAESFTRDLVVKWEANDQPVWELWKHVLAYAYAGIDKTLVRLGSHFDKIWYEHEHYNEGKKYVEQGLEKGVFKKLEDGAVLTNLEEQYGIPDTVLLKRDGTSLYITQDLALTALKKEYYQADKLIWVVGPDQTLALRQVFAVCEQLGIGALSDFKHVAYGYVGLKDENSGGMKKMSSREGTVVLIDEVIDEVKQKIETNEVELEREHKPAPELSEKLALAAVKFAILKPERTQDLTFDINQSVNVHGDSGVYVMYSYVRTESILEKFGREVIVSEAVDTKVGVEKDLLRTLAFFPSVIKRAGKDLSTHHIATYLLEVSSAFNSWYGNESILDGSEREAYKLAAVKATGQVIKNGLAILGIPTVEKM